jgi:hypothetical protein
VKLLRRGALFRPLPHVLAEARNVVTKCEPCPDHDGQQQEQPEQGHGPHHQAAGRGAWLADHADRPVGLFRGQQVAGLPAHVREQIFRRQHVFGQRDLKPFCPASTTTG